ncbi:hypothetical protein FACS189440_00240 [Bacteroidia bacterium]|nr:hypothetical protein FACS189423_03610 [Bacteroidia bacterium]GHT45032.1 hypothetical protein FACS189440_00240 [Bacteroidia bacterium]
MYGQYDTFVSLEFHIGSEAYNKYGKSLMGVFQYTLEQREELEKILKLKKIPFSSKRISFVPSALHEKLTAEQKLYLDKIGILNKDIACVSSVNKPRQNVFAQKGNKELPKPIEIKIDWSIKESCEIMLGFYKTRLKEGEKLCEIEKNNYYALRLYFEPDTILPEEHSYIQHTQTIREKFLNNKWEIESSLSDTEKTEIQNLWHSKWNVNRIALQKEIQRSGNSLEKLPIEMQMKLITLSCGFESEILSHCKDNTIWWDIERFLHIYIRHIGELQPDGKFKNKTIFQYDFKDIRKVITAVIESAHKEVEEEFKTNPTKNFNRQGKRAIYYNGNYYKIEIEPNGRLLTFHPYNDDKEREND